MDIKALVATLLPDGDDRLRADALLPGLAMGGVNAVRAALDLARLIGEAAASAEAVAAVADATDDDALDAAARLVILCFALIRDDYPSRQDATAARALLTGAADRAYPVLSPAGADALDWLVRLVGQTVVHLSEIAASRVPLVRVETGVSLPSTLAAYDLYGNAQRAGEIVRRNRLGTPMILPTGFEALAS